MRVIDSDAARSADVLPLNVLGQTLSDLVPTEALLEHAAEYSARYQAAKPFPHIVLEGLWRPDVLEAVNSEFPPVEDRDWHHWESENELKDTSKGISGLGPFSQLLFQQLNSEPFIQALEAITHLKNLVPDPTFYGAGLHEAFRDGWLAVHSDYINHRELPLARCVNLLVYLNHDWQADWHGDLELWEDGAAAPTVSIPPLFNQTVIFNTTTNALHGFTNPLRCPADRSRRLISVYYWSTDPSLLEQAADIRWRPVGRRRIGWRDFIPPIALRIGSKLRQLARGKQPPAVPG